MICFTGDFKDGMLVINLAQSGETVTMTAIWE